MKIIVFMTYGISMKKWEKIGILHRELRPYKIIAEKKKIKFIFVTYGAGDDYQFSSIVPNSKIIPLYDQIKYSKWKTIRFLSSFIAPYRLKKDIYKDAIIKTNQIWGNWVPILAKYVWKAPLIVRCGYEPYKNEINNKSSFFFKLSLRFLSMISYKNANLIITTTNDIKRFIIKSFNIDEKLILINRNWIDTKLFKNDKNIKRSNKILYVGRLHKEKNIQLLIRAIKNTNIHLDIIGDGEERNNLKALANSLSSRVKFLGKVENSLLPKYYNNHRIYIICSNYEGSPKTLLEAMACGAAVIGTDVPGIKNVIINNKNGLLVKKNSLELLRSIRKLLKDKELSDQLGIFARDYIVKKHSLGSYIKKEYKAYRFFN